MEIVSKKRTRLKDGSWGWTGVMRDIYSNDVTVIGYRSKFITVPFSYRTGNVGSKAERDFSKIVSRTDIEESRSG